MPKQLVHSFSRTFKDDPAICFNNRNWMGIEIEQTNVEPAIVSPSLFLDEVAQLRALDSGGHCELFQKFELGYFDRVEKRIIVVPFREISFPENDPGRFLLTDAEEQVHHVPFHRVREVYKDGQRIWKRPDPADVKFT